MHKVQPQAIPIGAETKRSLVTGYLDVRMAGGIITIAKIIVQSQDTMLEDMWLAGREATADRRQSITWDPNTFSLKNCFVSILEYFRANCDCWNIVISDLRMPAMNGIEPLQDIKKVNLLHRCY